MTVPLNQIISKVSKLSTLFPQRLKVKIPYWTVSRSEAICVQCNDDISLDAKIAIDPAQKGVFCSRCGRDIVTSGIPVNTAKWHTEGTETGRTAKNGRG